MKAKTVFTNGLSYETKKRLALNAEPIQKKVALSSINIDKNGLLYIGGERVAAVPEMENQLLKVLNMQPKFFQKFGKITNLAAKANLIETIKNGLALSDVKKQMITVVGSPISKMITNLLPGNVDVIPNSLSLTMFERIMNQHPELDLRSFEIGSDGSLNITLASTKQSCPIGRDGNKILGEDFNPGIHFNSGPLDGLNVQSFVMRLVCRNGMITEREKGMAVILNKLDNKSLDNFTASIKMLGENDFVPFLFSENVQKAIDTPCSFGELKHAAKIMVKNSKLKEKDMFEFLPELPTEIKKLAARGFDYARCSDAQLSNYALKDVKIWDVVNRVTDFGSHDYGFNANFDEIQRSAGKILTKKIYDAENLILLN